MKKRQKMRTPVSLLVLQVIFFLMPITVFSQIVADPDFLILGRDSVPKNGENVQGDFCYFDLHKSAFRGGSLHSSPNWSPDSVGFNSFGYGTDIKAKGLNSVALGTLVKANGHSSIAFGGASKANGGYSTAMGLQTIANQSNGMAIGQYNDPIVTIGTGISVNQESPLFIVGNGNSLSNRSNAMVIQKNGNIGIGTNTPTDKLEVHDGRIVIRLGQQAITMSGNEALGYAHFDVGGTTHSDDHIVIGDTAGVNKVGIGTPSPTQMMDVNGNGRFRNVGNGSSSNDLRLTSDGTLTTNTSDARLKENVSTLEKALEKVSQLRGVSFTWKEDPAAGTQHGLIAQEVLPVVPELVFKNGEYYGLDYSEMVGLFVEAIKELKEENDALKNEMTRMQNQINELYAMMNN